ncbi:MAG TPA: helix-hairpin-helix domain-containing protein [Candidatus Thermoplasmatota archaeon]|nr:helix-hairpin-helix domain-containing protein [Candidatus Thermoplasmatota archaeon]
MARPSSPSSLEHLEGVGPQLAEALRKRFRTDAAVLAAARKLDVASLASVDGVSERKAVDLIRQVLGLDRRGQEFLATPPSRKLHDEVLAKLLAHASTSAGKNRLRLLGPLPTPEEAERHAAKVLQHKATVAALDRDAVRAALRRLSRPTAPQPRLDPTRLVVCETDEIHDRLLSLGVHQWVTLAGARDLERAPGFDLVAYVYEDGTDLDGFDNVVEVPASAGLGEVAPNAVLAWAAHNRQAIEACQRLAKLTGKPSKAGDALAALGEATKAGVTPAQLRKQADAIARELDLELRTQVATLQLSGRDVLEALGKKIPAALQAVLDAALAEGRRRLLERTGHDGQPFAAAFPFAVDEEEMDRIERRIETVGRMETFQAQVRLARRLDGLRQALEQEAEGWLAFDAEFALGCFALENGLHAATFGDDLAFDASIHLDLAATPDVQRIAYRLGGPHPVALLTGANSGGKTTLLEHVGQLVLMARLGLPVVGEGVRVPWVDELHYVTARRSLDAGAFESFLRTFLPVVHGGRRRLVLADEVEAVTELEAAGRILGFVVDRLARDCPGSLAIVVSHMAPQVLRHVTQPVRVDGIEATGLDEEWRLIVDRTPRMGHFARSTPELIVQRLAATAKGPDQALYADLLALFRPDGRPNRDSRETGDSVPSTANSPRDPPKSLFGQSESESAQIVREAARPPRPAKGTRRGSQSGPS